MATLVDNWLHQRTQAGSWLMKSRSMSAVFMHLWVRHYSLMIKQFDIFLDGYVTSISCDLNSLSSLRIDAYEKGETWGNILLLLEPSPPEWAWSKACLPRDHSQGPRPPAPLKTLLVEGNQLGREHLNVVRELKNPPFPQFRDTGPVKFNSTLWRNLPCQRYL